MKIGVFDSGYGGLTVLKEIVKILPQYDYVYLGDNARTPYGNRSFETVYKYTLEAVKYLFSVDCKLVILACNTASAKALRSIQQNDLPKIAPDKRVLGVIRPSVEVINKYSKSGLIGVLATSGTVASKSYVLEINKISPHYKVYQQACPMWVPLVENNEHDSDGADFFVKKCIDKLLSQDSEIDTVVLACTHYPLLLTKIKKYLPKHIKIISQGKIVAPSLKDYLFRHSEIENRLSKNGVCQFLTTDIPVLFDKKAKIFMGKTKINSAKQVFFD
ncbi:MAG: glutamate racemase [Bacteroidales bacterium]|nr:glutamate racemase [Bacteroidales bacterium]